METVAVYSEPDREALHVRLATRAVAIGPAAPSASYLDADKLIQVGLDYSCDAVHPGYGFLSENADFARAVTQAGMVWVGPSPEAIVSMGSKTGARRIMEAAGVPVVPGTLDPCENLEDLAAEAAGIGFPIMLKAASGGGGKGMRLVHKPEDLERAWFAARSEAAKSFGDDTVYLEKAINKPRHVEVQILADTHGKVLHLFERDCSVQRRHQKVIEETPCPVLPEPTRKAMCEVAVQAARAVNYVGAGTVEFLLADDGSFYFLEMNTRLQVEHPITEMVTGIDLAKAQLRVAMGEALPWEQEDIQVNGHAMEFRIYAEDPANGFLPAPGKIEAYREPSGPWVRVDSGVYAGFEVPIHYDPMIAKLVVWGEDRQECLERADRALREFRITGIKTPIAFFRHVLTQADFRSGVYDTGFITPALMNAVNGVRREEIAAVVAAVAQYQADHTPKPRAERSAKVSAWKQDARLRSVRRGPQ
jgi:acetyl-CoA carboxylase biotin carboxylase subunit